MQKQITLIQSAKLVSYSRFCYTLALFILMRRLNPNNHDIIKLSLKSEYKNVSKLLFLLRKELRDRLQILLLIVSEFKRVA